LPRVLILLPPSEGKTAPQAGAPVDLDALAFPELNARRESLLDALAKLVAGSPKRALAALGLSVGQAGELDVDAALRTAPAAPAAEVYTGVLYERLRLGDFLDRQDVPVLIASALWGVVRPSDRIPAYRLSMGARLPRKPGLATWWRASLAKAMPDPDLVVDMRSGAYAAAWKPGSATTVAVRAFAESPDGSRRPISHMAKRVRGDVARALLLEPRAPACPEEVAGVAAAAGMRVELHPAGRDFTLDVVEPA
jgi:cytoplasmic iron level regulating protein YaaA (DUF328/UPF0246 family)